MKWGRWSVLVVAIVLASVATVRWSLRAQDRVGSGRASSFVRPVATPLQANKPADDPAVASVQDALLRPIDLPFAEPTSLADIQKFLAGSLGAPVVLDLAALDRLDLDPEDTVRLELKGVRLKTGLKLLLDQLGMTYRVEAEDNLLILTDALEGGEPIDRALRELKALHTEMHDLQDAVDDLRSLVEEELGVDPKGDPNAAVFVRFGPRSAPKVAPRRLEPRRRLLRSSPSAPVLNRSGLIVGARG